MKSAAWFSCLALVCSDFAPALHAQWCDWPHINAKLKSKQVSIRKVALLPSTVTFNKIGIRGSEGGISEGDQIAESFYAAVHQELSARGVEVVQCRLDQAKDDAARYAFADLQARFDNVAVQLRRKPDHVTKGGFTLGDRVAKFEPAADVAADTLVFVRGTGKVLTDARKAVSMATFSWFEAFGGFHGEVTFVDAKTGEVLAFVRFLDTAKNTDGHLARSLRRAIYEVPLPAPPKK